MLTEPKPDGSAPAAYSPQADLEWVRANRDALVEEYYGLSIIVCNQHVEGAYKSAQEACVEGSKRFAPDTFIVQNMLDYRCEEDKKWDDTLDNMTEEECTRLDQVFDAMTTGEYAPLDFTDK